MNVRMCGISFEMYGVRNAYKKAAVGILKKDGRRIMKQKLQSMMVRMGSKMQQFMIGRNGADELSQFTSILILVCLAVSLFTRWGIFYWLGIFCIGYSYFRMFSKNVSKRYAENQKFLTFRYKMTVKKNLAKKHLAESKTHRFFKCPQCKQKVRVPKGRGKICITCPKCKTEFVKKS